MPTTSLLTPSTVEKVQSMLGQKGPGWVRLRTLVVVSDSGSYRKACRPLGLSGISAIRGRIYTLQRELQSVQYGLVLVTSDASGAMLTPAAEELVEIARPFI